MINQWLNQLSFNANWVDLVFILLVLYFLLTQTGFIKTFFEMLGLIFSIIFSYRFYGFFAGWLIDYFSISKGFANVGGFIVAWFLSEIIFYLIFRKFISPLFKKFNLHPLNIALGFVAGFLQAGLLFLFIISLFFAFPIKGEIKKNILASETGPFFVNLSSRFEKSIKNIFGEAITETINFITIKPGSTDVVDLGISTRNVKFTVDEQSETTMFNLVNQEREKLGLKKLNFDGTIQQVARHYAQTMFENGFFSHVSQVDGSTPKDRAEKGGVSFFVIGENLAYAPDVYLAHQGLMNSEGHRANILAEEFGRLGVGVIDGEYNGKMFVLLFAD